MGVQSPTFVRLRVASNKVKEVTPFKGRILSLDPGETTGYCVFQAQEAEAELVDSGQIKAWPLAQGYDNLRLLIAKTFLEGPTDSRLIVFESYNVYEHKLEQHTHSNVPTLQLIGLIQTLCFQTDIPYITQTAQVGKGFVTDTKLKAWGFYHTGKKHARDATRHACYFLLFGNKNLT